MATQVRDRIDELVKSDRVVLFMKGTRAFPQCGFSATVVQILNGVVPQYTTVNVLSDPDIRQGVKEYSNWPTIPQLYVNGEFVGGCDIVREMYASGDLHQALGLDPKALVPPTLSITDRARAELEAALKDAGPDDVLHLGVGPDFEHSLGLGPAEPGEVKTEANGLIIMVDATSAERAEGLTIDFEDSGEASGFKMHNPNRPADVVEISATDLKKKIDAGEVEHIYDVRTDAERERASIAGSTAFDDATVQAIEALPAQTPLAFFCHHGVRSRQVAEHFRKKGFKTVYNMKGGIDAWSQDVDPSVPRY